MAESINAGQDFDEGAEFLDAGDRAFVDHALLGLCDDLADLTASAIHRLLRRREDTDHAIVIDVDLGAREGRDATDVLSARSNERTDLVDRNADRLNAGRVLRQFRTRSRHDGLDEIDDLHTSVVRALQRAFDGVPGQTANLEVHLETGDTITGAAHLEIHVAAVIFSTEDVGDEDLLALVSCREEPARDASNRLLDRNASVQEGQCTDADGSHRRRAV